MRFPQNPDRVPISHILIAYLPSFPQPDKNIDDLGGTRPQGQRRSQDFTIIGDISLASRNFATHTHVIQAAPLRTENPYSLQCE
jgi:hypothetical protein